MRRNIKNDKVLRAITIGLATMIAVTSTPVTVFAEDGETPAGEEQAGDKPEEKAEDKAEEGEKDNKEEKKEEQQQIPDDVKSATLGLQQAAENVETQKTTVDGQESVTGGIEAAKAAADKIIVPNGDGSFITVEKVVTTNDNGETVISYKTPDENTDKKNLVNVTDVKSDLEKAEGILNTKDETTGKYVGIYNDLSELQTAINNFYLANKSLNDKIGEFVEKDENGDLVFSVNNAKYQIVTIPGATENDATQYMVLKVENNGTTNLANVNEAFDTTIVDANGNDSRAKIQSDNADAAVEAAGKSNNAGNQADAENYKATALSLIKAAEDEFAIDSQQFEEAAQFANAAKEKLGEIEEQADVVNQRLNDIKSELNDLIGNDQKGGKATALNEQLKAAEARALALKQEAERQRSAISQYELLLQIRDADKNVQAEVEKNKAEAERLKKLKEEGQEVGTIPSITSGDYWKEARKLCYLLIKYYINNGDLAVMGANGEPIALTEGRQLEIGADFKKILDPYTILDEENVIRTDENGNPIAPKYGQKKQTEGDDYSITGTAAKDRSKFEFVKKDENDNITGMAYKYIDDKETGMGWIFASSEKSNDCNNNRVVVNIKDKDGKIIGTAYFNAKTNDDGSVYIYERECFEETVPVDGREAVMHQDAVEAKDEVPESWSTVYENKDNKTLLVSDINKEGSTIHKININDNDADAGFYAIDDDHLVDVSTDADRAVTAPSNTDVTNDNVRTQVSYAEVEGSSQIAYEKGEYSVVDGYNKMTTTKTESATTKEELKTLVDSYNQDGKTISKVEVPLVGNWITYNVDLNNVSWFDELVAKVNKFFGGDGLEINISYQEDNPNDPITHQEAGIYKVETKQYTETTTTTTSHVFKSKNGYGVNIYIPFTDILVYDAWGEADSNRKSKVSELQGNGYTVTGSEVVQELFDGKWGWTYKVYYDETAQSSKTVTKEVSRTQYAADTYTNHTLHEDAVEAKAEVKEVIGYDPYETTKLSWKTDKESQEKAKSTEMKGKANSLKTVNVEVDGKTKTRTVNKTSYKDLLAWLDAKDNEVADYDNLYNKVQSAVKASEKFVELLQRFTYPAGFSYTAGSATVSDAPQHGDLTPGDAANTRLVDSLTLDNFESTVGALLGNLKESVDNTFENISVAKDRQEKLAQKIRDARAAVNGIRDTDRFADNDDDDDDDDSGVTPGAGTFVLPGAGASTLASFDLSGMTFDDGRGVAGARTGRRTVASTNSGSGVLGARTEGENKEPVVVNDTKNKDSKGSTEKDNKKLEKIENNQIPLADAPFAEAFGLNWLWMLLAGAVGVGAYSYDRHRKKAAANEEMKKYKK